MLANSSDNELGGYDQAFPMCHLLQVSNYKLILCCVRGLSALIWKICWANRGLYVNISFLSILADCRVESLKESCFVFFNKEIVLPSP